MDYTISHKKLVDLIGKLIHEVYPNFAKGKCHVENMGNSDDPMFHYFTKENGVLAKYHPWSNSLYLRKDLFYRLWDYFGEKPMTLVIDWFNNEFDRDAESVSY